MISMTLSAAKDITCLKSTFSTTMEQLIRMEANTQASSDLTLELKWSKK